MNRSMLRFTTFKMASKDVLNNILGGLNRAQKAAVTSSEKGQLQIVAGPGTGKYLICLTWNPSKLTFNRENESFDF